MCNISGAHFRSSVGRYDFTFRSPSPINSFSYKIVFAIFYSKTSYTLLLCLEFLKDFLNSTLIALWAELYWTCNIVVINVFLIKLIPKLLFERGNYLYGCGSKQGQNSKKFPGFLEKFAPYLLPFKSHSFFSNISLAEYQKILGIGRWFYANNK